MTIDQKNKSFYLVVNTDRQEFTITLDKNCKDILKSLESEFVKYGYGQILAYMKVC